MSSKFPSCADFGLQGFKWATSPRLVQEFHGDPAPHQAALLLVEAAKHTDIHAILDQVDPVVWLVPFGAASIYLPGVKHSKGPGNAVKVPLREISRKPYVVVVSGDEAIVTSEQEARIARKS